MSEKFNINIKELDNLTDQISKSLNERDYEVECPHCGKNITIPVGKSACPYCKNIVDLSLKINL